MLARPITPAFVYPVNRNYRAPGIIPGLGGVGVGCVGCSCGCEGKPGGCGGGLGDMEIAGIGLPALLIAGAIWWVVSAANKRKQTRILRRILPKGQI